MKNLLESVIDLFAVNWIQFFELVLVHKAQILTIFVLESFRSEHTAIDTIQIGKIIQPVNHVIRCPIFRP